jgi:predicted RecA/RadA family phage recombinase
MKNYVQNGDVIGFTAGANIASGQVVVVGSHLAVATAPVASGAAGEGKLTGVFELPKSSGVAFTAGQAVMWDASAAAFATGTPATGDVSGAATAFAPAASAVTTALIRLGGNPGTVTA